jgi:hypothetical protein
VKISYSNFWDNFDIDNNWFNYMFMEYFNDDTIEFSNNHHGSDIIVVDESDNPEILPDDPIKIFYTGEYHKKGYDPEKHILLGFDPTDFSKRSYRLPVWYIYMNWWPEKFYPRLVRCGPIHNFDLDALCRIANENEIKSFLERDRFAVTTLGHFGWENNRLHAIKALNSIGQVDGYGDAFGRPDDRHKTDILKDYKFNLCFENRISPGYITAQITEAKFAGCIPIFWGDSEAKNDFNPECYIDYTQMGSMDELVETVRNIYFSEDLLVEKFSQPLFINRPSLAPLYEFLDEMGLKK